ncbi:E3 ubiquitin-protein ligase MGRN1-like [Panonychus citri]|uniref:E3 ubiquitin-protein ligase MGRN1-like n=1 Tax=Panonychus citri TaxID=50023 RepID=UPI0023079BBD|nr:E3 ubiquitin-protein ligase MGRN1-like [Panonychus citri]
MGNILYRTRDDEVEEESVNQSSTIHKHHGYIYPPKTGFYFGSSFFMGGEKFETGTPETYLFGDNSDLNFLGPKLMPFPYLAPLPDEPTRSLRVLVNIRKETLRLVKIPTATNEVDISSETIEINPKPAKVNCSSTITDYNSDCNKIFNKRLESNGLTGKIHSDDHELKEFPTSSTSTAALTTISLSSQQESSISIVSSSSSPSSSSLDLSPDQLYTIEFTFDSDVKCSVTIYYLAVEESTPSGNIYVPRDPTYKTATYHYPIGAGQIFSQPSLIFNPTLFNEDDLLYRAIDEFGNFDPTVPFPVVIQLNAEEGSEPRQSHSLIATVERNNEKQFYIKPFKQKIIIDGLAYLIQEVYGIENKNPIHSSTGNGGKASFYSSDEDIEDNGSECVICMSESRDTLILPCRHLCLCNACADSLRYQANNCPICRSPFRALLRFRAIRKVTNNTHGSTNTKVIVTQPAIEPSKPSSSSSKNKLRSTRSTPSSRPNTTIPNNNNATSGSTNSSKSEPPPGYEPVPLIEALNGPAQSSSSRPDESNHHGFQSSFDDEDAVRVSLSDS